MPKNKKILILHIVIVIIISITLSIGIFGNPEFNIYDFFGGFSAELIGMVFALVVVETYVNERVALRDTNKKNLSKIEVQDILLNIVKVYYSAYLSCEDKKEITKIDELFSYSSMYLIFNNLDLSQKCNVNTFTMKWIDFFNIKFKHILEKGMFIIANYSNDIEKDMLEKFYKLMNGGTLISQMGNIKEIYLAEDKPLHINSFFSCPNSSELENFVSLCNYYDLVIINNN